ncbi:MAG: hypothetical protein UW15_C0038G0001 [Parcubacteria group bacterium GW2011_GWC1_44_10]|nr:MAG: hypothetical protein UW15_C0038G0001 [Parcubacteria group bacterium GW2011_GWC1_44_10]
MNMNNQKGFVNVVLIVLVVILAGAVGYFALRKPTTEPVTSPTSNNIQPTQPQVTPPPANTTQTPTPMSQTNKPGWKVYAGTGFEVQYPENTFAVVQISKQLPPDYKSNYAGAKLISSARVSKLGKQECSYGESGLTSVCKAEMEGGIEFIQVNASAQSLTSSLDSSLKTTVTLAGKQTVKWSIGAEGEGTDYYYIPLNSSQTLVVARLYRFDGFPQQTLFNQVLATLLIK